MIKLVDALNITPADYKKYKIHFVTGAKDKKEPYNLFLIDEFAEWQSNQTSDKPE